MAEGIQNRDKEKKVKGWDGVWAKDNVDRLKWMSNGKVNGGIRRRQKIIIRCV
jgi:hypothetical protein